MSIVPASSYSWFENYGFYKKRHLFFGTHCRIAVKLDIINLSMQFKQSQSQVFNKFQPNPVEAGETWNFILKLPSSYYLTNGPVLC